MKVRKGNKRCGKMFGLLNFLKSVGGSTSESNSRSNNIQIASLESPNNGTTSRTSAIDNASVANDTAPDATEESLNLSSPSRSIRTPHSITVNESMFMGANASANDDSLIIISPPRIIGARRMTDPTLDESMANFLFGDESLNFIYSPRTSRFQRSTGGNPYLNQTPDTIILSDSDADDSSPIRSHTPAAFIDLCSPEGGRSQSRRRSTPQNISNSNSNSNSSNNNNDSSIDSSYKCPVCFESVRKREPISTKCGHVFCRSCIKAAVESSKKCPLCNKQLAMNEMFRIYI